MAIKTYKPTTPSRRHMTVSAFEGIDKKAKPERSLTEVLSKHAGRNSYGRITVRHRGGGNKQKYRIIDFKRDKDCLLYTSPGETARAELDVDTVLPGGERFLRRAREGFCLEDGVWLFPLESPEGGWSGDWYEGAAYTLRLYREDGALLLSLIHI